MTEIHRPPARIVHENVGLWHGLRQRVSALARAEVAGNALQFRSRHWAALRGLAMPLFDGANRRRPTACRASAFRSRRTTRCRAHRRSVPSTLPLRPETARRGD